MNYCFFPSWFGSQSHLIWEVVSFSIIAWSLLLVCFLGFFFFICCDQNEGLAGRKSHRANLLVMGRRQYWAQHSAEPVDKEVYRMLVWCRRVIAYKCDTGKRLTKLCSFGVLCAHLHFPLWMWKLITYCSPWEDWHGAVGLWGWCHKLWWAAVPRFLPPQLGSRTGPFSCKGRGSLLSFH